MIKTMWHILTLLWKHNATKRNYSWKSVLITTLLQGAFFGLLLLYIITLRTKTSCNLDWSLHEWLLVFLVDYIVVRLIIGIAGLSFETLPQIIKNRSLDQMLMYPIDTQWLLTFYNFDPLATVHLLIPTVTLIVVCHASNWTLQLLPLSIIAITIICAVVVIYSILSMLASVSLWFPENEQMETIFFMTQHFRLMPPSMLGEWIPIIFATVIPIRLVTFLPGIIKHGDISAFILISFTTTSLFFLIAARFLWKRGIRHYKCLQAN